MLTQGELAEAIGTSVQVIQNWEYGKHRPRPQWQRRLCEALGVKPEELFAALDMAASEGKAAA
jgi:DNA-binding transcriptional regulator YiaG